MARARVRANRTARDLSDVILAEWYRVLPPASVGGDPLPMDANALTGAFNQILDPMDQCQVILDVKSEPLRIVAPLPPHNVRTREDLEAYLERNSDFRQGMGLAMLFGCGR